MGDPHKLIQLEAFLKTMKKDNLLELVQVTGNYLADGLDILQRVYPNMLSNNRGKGTFRAVDMPDTETQLKVISMLRQEGVQIGGCGASTVRIRPSLTLDPSHVTIFLEKFEKVLKTL